VEKNTNNKESGVHDSKDAATSDTFADDSQTLDISVFISCHTAVNSHIINVSLLSQARDTCVANQAT